MMMELPFSVSKTHRHCSTPPCAGTWLHTQAGGRHASLRANTRPKGKGRPQIKLQVRLKESSYIYTSMAY